MNEYAIPSLQIAPCSTSSNELLTAAQQGRQTVITRHGRPVAVLAPISATGESRMQRSLLPLTGSGRGLYGRDTQATLRRLREEWSR